jgi:haloacid dehalogenase superfamily, subfamily IA, variant 3 with third motif having DD or ED
MTVRKEWVLIFDFGDVLFKWSQDVDFSGISTRLLKEFRCSEIWRQYVSGTLKEDEFYSQLASRFGSTATEVAKFSNKLRQTITQNTEVLALIRSFQARCPGLFRTYAMSNISAVDWSYLQGIQGFTFDVFDKIFLSFEMGTCKPALKSYQHLLETTSTDPSHAVLIDDNADNILAARSLGMHGIVFTTLNALERTLLNLLYDPVERGRSFLASNAKRMHSISSNGLEIQDNFSQLLIYEATRNM